MAAPIIVQTTTGTDSGFNNSLATTAFASSTTSGNAILAIVVDENTLNTVSSVTDSKGNTYVRIGSKNSTTVIDIEYWLCLNITGGATHTVTAHDSAFTLATVFAYEISGMPTSGTPYEQFTGLAGSSTYGAVTMGSATSNATDLIISAGAISSASGVWTAGLVAGSTGTNVLTSSASSEGMTSIAESNTVSSTGTYSATATNTVTNQVWVNTIIALSNVTIASTPTASVSDSTTTSENIKVAIVSQVNVSDNTTTSETISVSTSALSISVSDSTTVSEIVQEDYNTNVTYRNGFIDGQGITLGSNVTTGGNYGVVGVLGSSPSLRVHHSGSAYVFEGAEIAMPQKATIFQFMYRPEAGTTLGTGNSLFTAFTDGTYNTASAYIRLDLSFSTATTYTLALVDPSNSYTYTGGTTAWTVGNTLAIKLVQTSAGWNLYVNNGTTPEVTYTHTQTVVGVQNIGLGTIYENPSGSLSGYVSFSDLWAGNLLPTPSTPAQKAYDAYRGYLQNHLAVQGQPYRGPVDGHNLSSVASVDTVSESAAYLINLSVQNNDRYAFNLVDNWILNNLLRSNSTVGNTQSNAAPSNASNLMAFSYNSANSDGKGIATIYDANWAGDADVERMKNLFWAHGRWGSSALTVGTAAELANPNYLQRALNIESDLYNYAFVNSTTTGYNYLVADSFQQGNATVTIAPDYNDPVAYKQAAKYNSSHATFWNNAVSGAYDIVTKASNATITSYGTGVGLDTDFVQLDVSAGTVDSAASGYGTPNYGYNAFRIYARLYDMYAFYADSSAVTAIQNPKSFFTTYWGAHSVIPATFNHDGSSPAGYDNSMFTYAAYWTLYANDKTNSTASAIFSAKLASLYFQEPYGSIISNAPSGQGYAYFDQSWLIQNYMVTNNLWVNYGADDYISAADNATTSETITLAGSAPTNVPLTTADSIATSETLVVLVPIYKVSVSDATVASEAISAYDGEGIFVSDATATSEAIRLIVSINASVSDSSATSENLVLSTLVNVSNSDSTTTSETISVSVNSPATLAINVSDSTNVTETLGEAPADVIGVSDNVSVIDSVSYFSDLVATSERVTMMVDADPSISDSTTVSETITVAGLTIPLSVSDNVTVSESVTVGNALTTVSVSDNTSTSEVITLLTTGFISTSENTTVSESISVALVDLISVADSTVTSETITMRAVSFVSVSDAIVLSETISLTSVALVSVSDSTATSETLSLLESVSISVADNSVTSDSITLTDINFISVSDSTNTTENIVAFIPLLFITVTDSSATSETLNFNDQDGVFIVDNIATTETITVYINTTVSVSENSVTSETLSLNAIDLVSVSDSTVTSETIKLLNVGFISVADSTVTSETITVYEPLYYITVSDATTVSETQTVYLTGSGAFATENVTTSETITLLIPVLYSTVSDATTASESLTLLTTNYIAVSDSTTTSEALIELLVSLVNVSDAITVSETFKLLELAYVAVSDATITSETIIVTVPFYLVTVSDSTTTSESISLYDGEGLFVSDGIATSETITVQIPETISAVTDSINTLEAINVTLADQINTNDSTALTETINLLTFAYISISDITTASETIAVSPVSFVSVVDATSTSENIAVTALEFINVSDNTTLTETITFFIPTVISVSDSTITSETIQLLPVSFIRVSEAITTSEALTPNIVDLVKVSDNVSTSDSATIAPFKVLVNATDNITITEIINLLNVEFIRVSDATSISEHVAGSLSKNQFPIQVNVALQPRTIKVTLQTPTTIKVLLQPKTIKVQLQVATLSIPLQTNIIRVELQGK